MSKLHIHKHTAATPRDKGGNPGGRPVEGSQATGRTHGRECTVVKGERLPAGAGLKPGSRAAHSGQFQESGPRSEVDQAPRATNPLAGILGTFGGEEWDELRAELRRQREEE
jgi:hypothetical protein